MEVANIFMFKVVQFANFVLEIYMWIILGRVVISWVNADPYNPIVRFLYQATEPVLSRIRSVVPLNFGGFDFSPMVLIAGIWLIQSFLQALMH